MRHNPWHAMASFWGVAMVSIVPRSDDELYGGGRSKGGPRCASVHGFSLHANTQVPAH